jgi:hypothetical protein
MPSVLLMVLIEVGLSWMYQNAVVVMQGKVNGTLA